MKLAGIRPGDLILVDIQGGEVYARVTRVELHRGQVLFDPIFPKVGYHAASARQVREHWRKAGRGRRFERQQHEERVPA
jgi:translation initiation factor 2 gamma subunit (eIF-2gamma)